MPPREPQHPVSSLMAKPLAALACASPGLSGPRVLPCGNPHGPVSHFQPFGSASPRPPRLSLPAGRGTLGVAAWASVSAPGPSFALRCFLPLLAHPYASFRTRSPAASAPPQSLCSQNPLCLCFLLCCHHSLFTGVSPLLDGKSPPLQGQRLGLYLCPRLSHATC